MKRKWYIILVAVMAILVTASTAVPVLADTEEAVSTDSRPMLQALTIHAPRVVPVGEEVTMTVVERGTQDPVKGAGVWAISRDNVEALKQDVSSLREEGSSALREHDWASLLDGHGTFLGTTKGNGQLKHTFTEPGWYLLVTAKQGYFPSFTAIGIRPMLQALAIHAPRVAPVGEEVTMTVTQRGTQEPVKDAGVWAISRDNVEALKQDVSSLREEGSSALREHDWASLLSGHGTFLGTTKGKGQLKHTFTEPGWYLLVTAKQGYFPGFTAIGIRLLESIDT